MVWLGLVFLIIIIFGAVVFRGSPYVPSHKSDVSRALGELYHLGSNDVLVDIGSGDGIVLREAVKHGARAIGYEINPILVIISRLLSLNSKKVSIYLADFWRSSLPSDTTVIYVFSVSRDMKKIANKIQTETNRLNHSINLISYGSNKIVGMKVNKHVGAHYLYVFHPLQPDKPQV